VFERAVEHFDAAIANHKRAGDEDAAGRSAARLAEVAGNGMQRVGEGIARAEQALAELGESGSERTRAELAAILALLHNAQGASEPALVWAERACKLAERLDDTELLARAIGAKSWTMFQLGRHREALMLARGRIALAEMNGSLLAQAEASLYVSIFVLDEDPHEAIRVQLESAELARRAGARTLETVNLLNAAEGAIGLGQWDDARVALGALRQRELSTPRQIQLELCESLLAAFSGDLALAFARLDANADTAHSENVVSRSNYHLMRANVHLVADDLEAAYRHASASLDAEPSGINSPAALAIQMRTALWLGDAARARDTRSGLQGFRGSWMAAMRLTTEAGLAALEGRHEEAAAAYERAFEAWRALDSPLDLALCALDRAILRGSRPANGEDDEAREILTRIGATPFLARLDRAGAAARKVG
jgi:hypothetical protein